jgi:hypothetical protein
VTAIARKLGYPVRLAHAHQHRYCRWEDSETTFNIEASNPMGMTVESDEEYRKMRGGLPSEFAHSTYHFRSLTPAEEFAGFMFDRVCVLYDAGRLDETFLWSARALQFAPDDPIFPITAYNITDRALKKRLAKKHPEIEIKDGSDFYFQIGDLIAPIECSLIMTINAHYREARGELDLARQAHENACRHNFHGNTEQRDYQRFLKKYNLPKKPKPLLPPENMGVERKFKLNCRPEQEADELLKMADHFIKTGQPLNARNALRDLYLFDPADAEIFQRARLVEKNPLFQTQLNATVKRPKPDPLALYRQKGRSCFPRN